MKRYTLLFTLFLLVIALNADQLVIYQNNLAMINRGIETTLTEGVQDFSVDHIPETIIPESVVLTFKQEGIKIFDQEFNTTFRSRDELLRNSLNQEITVYNENGDRFAGVLVMFDSQFLTIRSDDVLELINMDNISNFNIVNDAKDSRLNWRLLSDQNTSVEGNLSYICHQINWAANYNAIWDDTSKSLTLNGWTTIKNNTHFYFDEVELALFAGDLNMQQSQIMFQERGMSKMAPGFSPTTEMVSDFYLYNYPQPVTVKPFTEKNLTFIDPITLPAENHYKYNTYSNKVESSIQFRNTESVGLGKPLPKGLIKVYSEEEEQLIFIGEDGIDHTAKDEKVSITNGYAFDLSAETIVVDQRKESNRVSEKDIKVVIKNRSKETKMVSVIHRLSGYWQIPRNSVNYQRRKANEIEFVISINPDETEEITWTEHIEY